MIISTVKYNDNLMFKQNISKPKFSAELYSGQFQPKDYTLDNLKALYLSKPALNAGFSKHLSHLRENRLIISIKKMATQ